MEEQTIEELRKKLETFDKKKLIILLLQKEFEVSALENRIVEDEEGEDSLRAELFKTEEFLKEKETMILTLQKRNSKIEAENESLRAENEKLKQGK